MDSWEGMGALPNARIPNLAQYVRPQVSGGWGVGGVSLPESPHGPDPEYRTRENLGERLVHFVLKAKTVFSPRFFACGTFSTFLYG
jgi:hypothetical protein